MANTFKKDNKSITKCNFCVYFVGKACTVRPDSYYCREAQNEFYAWLKAQKAKYANKK